MAKYVLSKIKIRVRRTNESSPELITLSPGTVTSKQIYDILYSIDKNGNDVFEGDIEIMGNIYSGFDE